MRTDMRGRTRRTRSRTEGLAFGALMRAFRRRKQKNTGGKIKERGRKPRIPTIEVVDRWSPVLGEKEGRNGAGENVGRYVEPGA